MMSQTKKQEVYIIAEAGVNHNGSKKLALELIDIAAEAGANAVKFQTFKAKKLATAQAKKAEYQKKTTEEAESQLEMLEKLELPEIWHEELQMHAKKCGLDFLSTAFDSESLSFLQNLDLPMYKIPSGELTNAPLLWHFAKTGKPLILSTGMAFLSEVEQALAILAHGLCHEQAPKNLQEVWQHWGSNQAQEKLQERVSLLHCTSQYPTPWEEVNLRAMDTLKAAFDLNIGYSDHTQGTLVSIAAVARGAKILEKHFTLDKNLPGPDHQASLEPGELKHMVEQIRCLEKALGSSLKAPNPSEWDTRSAARQSIIAAKPLYAGQSIKEGDLNTARAHQGISAAKYWDLLDSIANKSYAVGEALEG